MKKNSTLSQSYTCNNRQMQKQNTPNNPSQRKTQNPKSHSFHSILNNATTPNHIHSKTTLFLTNPQTFTQSCIQKVLKIISKKVQISNNNSYHYKLILFTTIPFILTPVTSIIRSKN